MKPRSLNKFTRTCENYTTALQNTCRSLGISKEIGHKVIMKYISVCKKRLLMGERVQFPKILIMSLHHNQRKHLRRFMTYKQRKKRYGHMEWFKISNSKKKKNVNNSLL